MYVRVNKLICHLPCFININSLPNTKCSCC